MDAIHLFVPTFRVEETLDAIRECLEKGWTGLGFKTVDFEEAWKRYSGLPHAHFLNSATAGLHLALRLLKEAEQWRDGDEVISTPLTFVSTNHAILYEKLRPVFADIDEHLCLDPVVVAARIVLLNHFCRWPIPTEFRRSKMQRVEKGGETGFHVGERFVQGKLLA
jgi:dTDP-4-amino-4,6-dideoxygalactose transaminase